LIKLSILTAHNNTTGVVTAGGLETHAISVKPGYVYSFYRQGTLGMNYSFYTSAGTFITGASDIQGKAPANAAILYVEIPSPVLLDVLVIIEGQYRFLDYVPYTQKSITFQPVQGLYKSKWYEKPWYVLGDSISTGIGDGDGANNNFANKPYHYVLSRERNIRVQVGAVSGYNVSQLYNNIVVNMPPTAYAPDLITVMIGTNDHGFATALGAITDIPASGTSFYAVYRKLIEYLITNFPNASIGLITPIQRSVGGSGTDGNVANAAGFTLRQYCDAVVALGNYYSIPILDWYTNLGFSPYNDTQKATFYCGTTPDGTHPNDLGHLKMSAKVGDFIERL
jgi:lysophospholipase L1-like esterase